MQNEEMTTVECTWEEIQPRLVSYLGLPVHHEVLELFFQAFEAGIRTFALQSLAYLVKQEIDQYARAVKNLAFFLTEADRDSQLACIYVLIKCRSPVEWQLQESVLTKSLAYITDFQCQNWKYPNHSETKLLSDLRSAYMNSRIRQNASTTASIISQTADFVKSGLEYTTNIVTSGIEMVGNSIQNKVPKVGVDPRVGMALEYADKAIQKKDETKEKTSNVTDFLKKVGKKGMEFAVQKIKEERVMEKFVPDPRKRTVLAAAGTVGAAGLGATLTVSEAVAGSKEEVNQATTTAAMNVLQHRYGKPTVNLAKKAGRRLGLAERYRKKKSTCASKVKKVLPKWSNKLQKKLAGPPKPIDVPLRDLYSPDTGSQ